MSSADGGFSRNCCTSVVGAGASARSSLVALSMNSTISSLIVLKTGFFRFGDVGKKKKGKKKEKKTEKRKRKRRGERGGGRREVCKKKEREERKRKKRERKKRGERKRGKKGKVKKRKKNKGEGSEGGKQNKRRGGMAGGLDKKTRNTDGGEREKDATETKQAQHRQATYISFNACACLAHLGARQDMEYSISTPHSLVPVPSERGTPKAEPMPRSRATEASGFRSASTCE